MANPVSQQSWFLGLRLALSSAVGYLMRNLGRTLAATAAAALGAAVLAASLVLTNSAQLGVKQQFLNLKSSRLLVSSTKGKPGWLTDSQLEHTAALPGVSAACRQSAVSVSQLFSKTPSQEVSYQSRSYAISPGCPASLGLEITQGRDFQPHERRAGTRVVVLGSAVAQALGITNLTGGDLIFIDGYGYSVIGIFGLAETGDIASAMQVYLASQLAAPPGVRWQAEEAVIDTHPAASDAVAAVIASSLSPGDPQDLYVLVGAIPTGLQSAVSEQLALLLMALGIISLLIGLFVIGNQSLQSVGLRRSEIALRRALGQPRLVVLAQVVCETTSYGAIGGFLGALLGQLVAALIAIAQGWPPLTNIYLVPLSALVGAIIGALAGAYPAYVASTTDPAEELKAS